MLTAFLAERTEPIVELTFAELDRLIGELPASAREHPAWWTNSRSAQPHARYWLDAKRRARADFNTARVRFEIGAETIGHGRGKPIAKEPSQATADAVEVVGATVRFEWRSAGAAALDAAGKPVFPAVPLHPGVYRFELADGNGTLLGIYIGESDNLTRRMGHYRNPGPTQPTNQRMNKRFRDGSFDGRIGRGCCLNAGNG